MNTSNIKHSTQSSDKQRQKLLKLMQEVVSERKHYLQALKKEVDKTRELFNMSSAEYGKR